MLKDARQLLGLTLDDLEILTKLSRHTIINVERGFGLHQSHETLRGCIIASYYELGPLKPEQKDRAFRILMGLDTTSNEPENFGKKRGRSLRQTGNPDSKKDTAAAPANAVALRENSNAKITGCIRVAEELANVGPAHSHAISEAVEADVQEGLCQTTGGGQEGNSFQKLEEELGAVGRPSLSQDNPEGRPLEGSARSPSTTPLALPENWQDAADEYARLTSLKPVPRKVITALYKHCQNQIWAADSSGAPPTLKAIQKRLSRRTNIQQRERRGNTSTQRRNAAIVEILSGPVSQRRRDSHNKGDGDRALGSLRKVIKGVMASEDIQRQLEEHRDILGKTPCLTSIERLLRERRGFSSPREEHRDHLEKTIGFHADCADQVAIVDATGWPVRFRYGDDRGENKRWIFVCADVASGLVRYAQMSATSESEGWKPKDPNRQDVMLQFLKQMNHFPEWLINDAISTLTEGLRYLKPGMHPSEKLSAGTLLWLLGGTRPYVRMGKRPTGGAHVERNILGVKDHLVEVGSQRAVDMEARGLGLKRITDCDNELDFLDMLGRAIQKQNSEPLQRRGCPLSRLQLNALESGQRFRDLHAQAEDLWEPVERVNLSTGEIFPGKPKWWQLAACAKTGVILNGRVTVRNSAGKPWSAQLVEPEQGFGCKPEEKFALILPSGARRGDDPESFRMLIIDAGHGEEKNRVQYHPCTALSTKIDEYYQDLSTPRIGQFEKAPERAADAFARNREGDAAAYRKKIRQGTTDEVVESANNWA